METARFLSNRDRQLAGVRRLVQVPAPAAGLDWSVKVPSGVLWRMLGGQATLTTGAAAGNRVPLIQLVASGVVAWIGSPGSAFGPGSGVSIVYTQSDGVISGIAANQFAVTPVGAMWLTQGDTIGTSTANLALADTFTAISLLVEECYFTNEELSEMAEERYEYAMAEGRQRQGMVR